QLRSISVRENDPNVALRLIVESGGCHGYQYKLELTSVNTDGSTPEDFLFVHPTKQPSHVLVDPISMTLLKGSTVDFTTELIGSSFNIIDNPQAKGGCGCGVSWEATI
ncbi:[4Fe-4S] proteins maturation, partial [Tulasnella sp. 418]